MQKYSPIDNSTPNMREDSENGSFYWCADADNRIEQLERALKSCSFVLKQHLQHTEKHYVLEQEALLEADKALAVSSSS